MGNLTTSTIPPPPVTSLDRCAPSVAELPHAAAQDACDQFGGRTWHHRPGHEHVLQRVAPAAWAQPQAQGWQRVKHNARREVWRAEIGSIACYLKYHFHDTGLRALGRLFRNGSCKTEWQGGLYAMRAGISAIEPIAYTTDLQRGDRRCDLLITAAVEPARPLNEFWLEVMTDDDVVRRRADKGQLIELLGRLIARSHQAGFEHLDMHAANILVQPTAPRCYRAVFVDLQSARRGVPISDRAVVRNLAQLNQWFRRHSSVGDRLRFLQAYLRWRNEFETLCEHGRPLGLRFEQLVEALTSAAHRHANRLWAQRDRRLSRTGRYFTRVRLHGGWRGMAVVRCKHPDEESRASQLEFECSWWQKVLANPLGLLGDFAADACKDSHSGAVARIAIKHDSGNVGMIVKRPRARNGWRRLVQLLPPSRSCRGWRRGHSLLHRDIPTARPLAVLERRAGPLVLDSLLLTEALPDAVDLERYLRQMQATYSPAAWSRRKRELLPLLVRHVRLLQDRGFHHRDCKASNILVVQQRKPNLLWIDMDGLRHVGRLSHGQRLLPLVRLHVSLLRVPGLTRTDRVRFLKAYCARFGAPHDAWRGTWRNVDTLIGQKVSAKEARRQWKLKHYGRE